MRITPVKKGLGQCGSGQSGVTLIETAVALAIIGMVSVAFLSGLTTTSRATTIADEKATAESLAQSQMEAVKRAEYVYEASQYPPAPVPGDDAYVGYSVVISAQPLDVPDGGVQTITVVVTRLGTEVRRLEGYKVDR